MDDCTNKDADPTQAPKKRMNRAERLELELVRDLVARRTIGLLINHSAFK